MNWTFVVQLQAEWGPSETLRGRVEHVHTGEAARLEGLEELGRFLSGAIEHEKQTQA